MDSVSAIANFKNSLSGTATPAIPTLTSHNSASLGRPINMSNLKSNPIAHTTGNMFKKRKGTIDPSDQKIDIGENNGSVLLIQNNTNYYIGNSVLDKNPIMMKNAFSSKQARH